MSTFDYFDLWSWNGALERIHAALYAKCREAAAREASPTAGIIPGSKSPGTARARRKRSYGCGRRPELVG
jgi:putative transposase